MPSSASTQPNSTSTQTKAEVSFILEQIQPPSHPPDQTSRERRLKCQFQFQLKQRLRLRGGWRGGVGGWIKVEINANPAQPTELKLS